MPVFLSLLGAIAIAAGAFAFLTPLAFFDAFALYTGQPNEHLIRDVGAAYLTSGFALSWAAATPKWRAPLVSVAAAFLLLHALGHIVDLASGRTGVDHLLADTVQVFVPAALLSALAVYFYRRSDG